MLYAWNDGGKVHATKGATGYCPDCQAQMIPKCGTIMTPHWAHKTLIDCDTWSEGETEWHREWKGHFKEEDVEVSITKDGKRHRADVHLTSPIGKVRTIEFQHSSISAEEIEAREAFYGKNEMMWVFDAKDAYRSKRFWFESANKTTADGKKLRVSDWKHGKKSLLSCDAVVILDFGPPDPERTTQSDMPHWLFRVVSMGTYWREAEYEGHISVSERMNVTGYFRTKEQFLSTFSTNKLHI